MESQNSIHDSFSYSQCPTPEFVEIPDVDDGGMQPTLPTSNNVAARRIRTTSDEREQSQPDKLVLVQLSEWDEEKAYNEDPSRYIPYDFRWKITVNTKRKTGDSATDVFLTPSAYWPRYIEPEVNEFLDEWQSDGKPLILVDANVVVSVTQRGQSPFEKRFKKSGPLWPTVEKQILKWEEFVRANKKIKVEVSLNYKESDGSSSKKEKTGTATQRQLAALTLQRDAEAERGQIIKDTYKIFRCEDKFCNLHNYCWHDPVKDKHFPLSSFDMVEITDRNLKGDALTHDNFLDDMRRALYVMEQQKSSRKRARTTTTIQERISEAPLPALHIPEERRAQKVRQDSLSPLGIPGYCEDAIDDFVQHMKDKWRNQDRKKQFAEMGRVLHREGLDLDYVHMDQNPKLFTDEGIPKVAVDLFFRDLPIYAKRRKLALY